MISFFPQPRQSPAVIQAVLAELTKVGNRQLLEATGGSIEATRTALREGRLDEYWINDADFAWANVLAVVKQPSLWDDLAALLSDVVPTVKAFDEAMESLLDQTSEGSTLGQPALARDAIVAHALAYAHVPSVSRVPYGGRGQRHGSVRDVWSAQSIIAELDILHTELTSTSGKVTNVEWDDALREAAEQEILTLIDLPGVSTSALYRSPVEYYEDVNEVLRHNQGAAWVAAMELDEARRDAFSWGEYSTFLYPDTLNTGLIVRPSAPAW